MATLEEEIDDLKALIARRELEYDAATEPIDKRELRQLITAENTLTELLRAPSLINSLDVAVTAVTMSGLRAEIAKHWRHYMKYLSPVGFRNYINDHDSFAKYLQAAASTGTSSVGEVRMSALSLANVDVSSGSGLDIRYWRPNATAIQTALSTRFGDRLLGIVSSLVGSLESIRAMLLYLKNTTRENGQMNEIKHIQPIFQMFLKELCDLCEWDEGREVFNARSVRLQASLPRKGDPANRLICSGMLDVLSLTGAWDPFNIDAVDVHLIAEIKRPFDERLMVGSCNGAAAQTMAQCEGLLQNWSHGKIVAACSTDLFALSPHLAVKDEHGNTFHLIGRRVCNTEEYVRLLMYLCLGHSKESFDSSRNNDSCELNVDEACDEFDIDMAGPGQMQDENIEPMSELWTRSGGKYKRAADEQCNEFYEDDDTTREQIEHLRRWNERFQGRRVLMESDMCNR